MAMLKVNRAQLIDGIRVLDGMVMRKQAKAILTFTDGVLSIKIANTIVGIRTRKQAHQHSCEVGTKSSR